MRVSANVVAAVLLFSVPQGVDAIEEDMVYRNISGAILTDDDSQTGVDVSTLMTKDTAACIAGKGMNFVIPRAFRSSGTIDDNACSTLSHAKTAGIPFRDVYMFPCPTCSASAKSQLNTMIDNLEANCPAKWTKGIWLDIEGSTTWTGSTSSNKAWYEDLVNACIVASKTYGYHCGVYSSASQWSAIFGSTSYCFGQGLRLWYAHYDDNPSFSDYTEFGCWKYPVLKQYEGTTTLCSQSVDMNWGNPILGPTPTPAPDGTCSDDMTGWYCAGDEISGEPNSIYFCDGSAGLATNVTACSEACEVVPGSNDKCVTGACTGSMVGYYCGDDGIGGDPDGLYYCEDGAVTSATQCTNGCVTAAKGSNDYCA